MLDAAHDESVDAWYFQAKGVAGDRFTDRTVTLHSRTVIIDIDKDGNVLGVEVL